MDEVAAMDHTPGSSVFASDVKSCHNLSEHQLGYGHWSSHEFLIDESLTVKKRNQHHLASPQCLLRFLRTVFLGSEPFSGLLLALRVILINPRLIHCDHNLQKSGLVDPQSCPKVTNFVVLLTICWSVSMCGMYLAHLLDRCKSFVKIWWRVVTDSPVWACSLGRVMRRSWATRVSTRLTLALDLPVLHLGAHSKSTSCIRPDWN